MKIKKYTARTEQEAIEKVKVELGLSALILNIKTIQPQGVFAIFRRPTVEVTAAYDEGKPKREQAEKERTPKEQNQNEQTENETERKENTVLLLHQERIKRLEENLSIKEDMLENVMRQLSAASHYTQLRERKYENNMIQVFYDTLIQQGVSEEIAAELLKDINMVEKADEININLIAKIVYNTIIKIIGEPSELVADGQGKVIIFIGPTGVGKTTTIAKLTSNFVLNEALNIGLITADTYRIAAVEQLKTYAEILGIDVGVVYNAEDLVTNLKDMREEKDLILVDTAGRSHKNTQNLDELKGLLDAVPDSEKFLVLSLTTKFEDLMQIIKRYSEITDFRIIFTKLDETLNLGSILNICYLTNKKISYVTDGQNVPDDIRVISPEKIARALLGLGA